MCSCSMLMLFNTDGIEQECHSEEGRTVGALIGRHPVPR